MFTLRKVFKNGSVSNVEIGNDYLFLDRDVCPELFNNGHNKSYVETYGDKLVGLVWCYNGTKSHCIFNGQKTYIVNENGSTFENITRCNVLPKDYVDSDEDVIESDSNPICDALILAIESDMYRDRDPIHDQFNAGLQHACKKIEEYFGN